MKILFTLIFSLVYINFNYSQNIFPTSGNVGIGTTTPQFALHIKSNLFEKRNFKLEGGMLLIGDVTLPGSEPFSFSKFLIDSPIFINSDFPAIRMNRKNIVSSWIDFGIAYCNSCYSNNALINDIVLRGATLGSFIISNDQTGDIKFSTREILGQTSKVQMIIDKLGNVGIGTETPDAKLAVNGLIHAKEVKVDLIGWPDYVFLDNYNLKKLEIVEEYIKKNKRLEDIPSASEVEKNGLNIAELINYY